SVSSWRSGEGVRPRDRRRVRPSRRDRETRARGSDDRGPDQIEQERGENDDQTAERRDREWPGGVTRVTRQERVERGDDVGRARILAGPGAPAVEPRQGGGAVILAPREDQRRD